MKKVEHGGVRTDREADEGRSAPSEHPGGELNEDGDQGREQDALQIKSAPRLLRVNVAEPGEPQRPHQQQK
ncbi:hypothetical protein [Deinococcus planocerae]|uniref:hypothetical protein n=1 Tax=Deinococcus planocerae TaxID=1737569 RepID=UPI0011AF805C|nr:hypothetical protein [Deinococcus planocerae]